MPKKPRPTEYVLEEILEAIEGIQKALCGIDYETYKNDWLVRSAIERGIEIISEGARHVPDEYCDRFPDIRWRSIRAMGNVLRHEYFQIDDQLV
jgi:uncharacterized protein with HEPN domain